MECFIPASVSRLGASHFSLLVQRKVTKRKHTRAARPARCAPRVRKSAGHFSKAHPCALEKRHASCVPPFGYSPSRIAAPHGTRNCKSKSRKHHQKYPSSFFFSIEAVGSWSITLPCRSELVVTSISAMIASSVSASDSMAPVSG